MYFVAPGEVCPGANTAAKGPRSQPVSIRAGEQLPLGLLGEGEVSTPSASPPLPAVLSGTSQPGAPEAQSQYQVPCWAGRVKCRPRSPAPRPQTAAPHQEHVIDGTSPEKSASARAVGRAANDHSLNDFANNRAQRSLKESHPLSIRKAEPVVNTLLQFISRDGGGEGRPGELFPCVDRLRPDVCMSPVARVPFSFYSREEK